MEARTLPCPVKSLNAQNSRIGASPPSFKVLARHFPLPWLLRKFWRIEHILLSDIDAGDASRLMIRHTFSISSAGRDITSLPKWRSDFSTETSHYDVFPAASVVISSSSIQGNEICDFRQHADVGHSAARCIHREDKHITHVSLTPIVKVDSLWRIDEGSR